MNLIRKHKISLITGIPLTGIDKEIFDFIEDKLSNIITFQDNQFHDSIFFMKDGEVILEQDSKTDTFYCSNEGLWEVLRSKYEMVFEDIQTLIKYMVEQAFKIKVGTPTCCRVLMYSVVKQAFKNNKWKKLN